METPESKAERSRKAVLALVIYISVPLVLFVLFGIAFGCLFPLKTFT